MEPTPLTVRGDQTRLSCVKTANIANSTPSLALDIGETNLSLTNIRSRKPLPLKPLAGISVNQRFPILRLPRSDIGKIHLSLTNTRLATHWPSNISV